MRIGHEGQDRRGFPVAEDPAFRRQLRLSCRAETAHEAQVLPQDPLGRGCVTQKWQIARIPFLWRVSECLDTLSTRRPPLMPNSLPELEAERSKLLRQFTTLGDL